jgi:hypothetical protein
VVDVSHRAHVHVRFCSLELLLAHDALLLLLAPIIAVDRVQARLKILSVTELDTSA